MGLSQTNPTVNKQRVIRFARTLADLAGGGPGKLIALALDEIIKRKRWAKPGRDCRRWRLHLKSRWPGWRRHGAHRSLPGADLDHNFYTVAGTVDELENSVDVVFL